MVLGGPGDLLPFLPEHTKPMRIIWIITTEYLIGTMRWSNLLSFDSRVSWHSREAWRSFRTLWFSDRNSWQEIKGTLLLKLTAVHQTMTIFCSVLLLTLYD